MATLQDRFNINSQLEHLQAKYIGTGHADLQRFEWAGRQLTGCLGVHLSPQHDLSVSCTAAYVQLRQPRVPLLQQRLCLTLPLRLRNDQILHR